MARSLKVGIEGGQVTRVTLSEAEEAVVRHLVAGEDPDLDAAARSTIHFRKTRAYPSCQLHFVSYRTPAGSPRDLALRTWQNPDGAWSVGVIGGGAGSPARSRPWVNLVAQWNAELFAGGGEVMGDGAEVARSVRLIFADGAITEDTVDEGMVLFFVEPGVVVPAEVLILDERNNVLNSYDEYLAFI